MNILNVNLGKRSYNIYIERDLLTQLPDLLKKFNIKSQSVLISNPKIFELYGESVIRCLQYADIKCRAIIIPDGEEYKDLFWAYHILTEMLRYGLDRKSFVFALGGGVIGDITGFAASLYMRGIPFIQIPTTLLSQVDSSVGGKTGVNHTLGKNMIGSFYQPKAVFIDTNTLNSLSEREFLCGLAEVIKYGVISNSAFFEYLENNIESILDRDSHKLAHIIKTSCEIKAKIVSEDERESGWRAILNYGHTIGHAIETETGYTTYKHGEAIAIGMVYEAKIAQRLGICSADDVKHISKLIDSYRLPTQLPSGLSIDRLITHIMIDKKNESGKVTIITPSKIGSVTITKAVNIDDIKAVLNY